MKFVGFLLIAMLGLLCPSAAFAVDCTSTVIDDAHVFTDVGKVQAAANALQGMNVKVRIRTVPALPANFHGMTAYMESQWDSGCREWANASGKHWANDLIAIGFSAAEAGGSFGFGIDQEPRLGKGRYKDIIRDRLAPAIALFKQGDRNALTNGFVAMLNEVQGVMARPSLGGNTVIHQASDYSGFAKVFGWIVALLALAAAGFAAWLWMSKENERKSAQAGAKNARAQTTTALLALNDRDTVAIMGVNAEAKPALAALFTKYKKLAQAGLQQLSTFDDLGGTDPNNKRLDKGTYDSNRGLYEAIMRDYVKPAQDLARQIQAGAPDRVERVHRRVDQQPPVQPPAPPAPPPPVQEPSQAAQEAPQQPSSVWGTGSSGYQSPPPYTPPAPPPPAPPPPYVPPYTPPTPPPRDDSFATGMLGGIAGVAIGEALSDHHSRRNRDDDDDYSARRQRDYRRDDFSIDRDSDNSSSSRSRQDSDGGDFGGSSSRKSSPSYSAPSQSDDDDDDRSSDSGGDFSSSDSSSSSSSDDGGDF